MPNKATSSSSVPLVEEDEEELVYGSESGWVEARTNCVHLATALSSDLIHIPTPDTHCTREEELTSNFLEEKKLTAALQIDLEEKNKQNETFEKVINKFFEIRQQSQNGSCEDGSWEDKCECLLQDSPEMWDFNAQGESSTSKYIVN